MNFWGASFSEHIRFWPVFSVSKKFSVHFPTTESFISTHISMCTFLMYIVLDGYKLLLTSYIGLKTRKNDKFCNLCLSFVFSLIREGVKRHCDSYIQVFW